MMGLLFDVFVFIGVSILSSGGVLGVVEYFIFLCVSLAWVSWCMCTKMLSKLCKLVNDI